MSPEVAVESNNGEGKFLERAERLMYLQQEIRDALKANPDIPPTELREKMDRFYAKTPSSPSEKALAAEVVRRYYVQPEVLKSFLAEKNDDRVRFEDVFGFPPNGVVEFKLRGLSLHVSCHDHKDFQHIVGAFDLGKDFDPGHAMAISKNTKGLRRKELLGALTVSKMFTDEAPEVLQKEQVIFEEHEEEHHIQALMREVFFGMTKANEMSDAKREAIRQRLLRAKDDTEFLKHAHAMANIIRVQFLDSEVAEELLSQAMHFGNIPGEIRNAINKGYVGQWRRTQREGMRKLFASKQTELTDRVVKQADRDFFEALRNGLSGLEKTLTMLPPDQAVWLLNTVPFGEWRETADRLEKRWRIKRPRKRKK